MEMILILIIAGVIGWVIKITFFHTPATEKPAKVKRVPVVDTFADPTPDVPSKKFTWGSYKEDENTWVNSGTFNPGFRYMKDWDED
jgi:hypothetical protein